MISAAVLASSPPTEYASATLEVGQLLGEGGDAGESAWIRTKALTTLGG
jgi:hypothetical protein